MSSQIFERDQQYGLEPAWHGATVIPESGKIERDEVYPYEIVLVPLYLRNEQGEFRRHKVEDLRGDGRTTGEFRGAQWHVPTCSDDHLPVGNGNPINSATYGLRTPHDDWDFVESVLEGGGHEIVSAGTVKNRSRHFIVAELEESSVDIDHRHFGGYLNWIGSLDRSYALTGIQSQTCTVCHNTLSANVALADARLAEKATADCEKWDGAVRIAHTKNCNEKVEALRASMRGALVLSGLFGEAMTDLRDTPVAVDRAREIYIGHTAPREVKRNEDLSSRSLNIVDDLVTLFRDGKGNNGETALDVLSGLTEYRTTGGEVSRDSTKDPRARWESSEFGSGAREKEEFARALIGDRGEALATRGKAILTS